MKQKNLPPGLPGQLRPFLALVCFMLATGLFATLPILAQDAGTQSAKPALKLTGVVTDENKNPLPGVGVSVKGSTRGTLTDVYGRFSIDVAAGAKIIVSHTGFIQQEFTASSQELMIVLKDDVKQLEEVSIGYQRLRKSDVTGAISSVKASELNLTAPTISQALVGKVAGVQVSQVEWCSLFRHKDPGTGHWFNQRKL